MSDEKRRVHCPQCLGNLESNAIVCGEHACQIVRVPCALCRGLGDLPREQLVWIEHGRTIRRERIAADRSLSEEAQRRGISVVELSEEERGARPPILGGAR